MDLCFILFYSTHQYVKNMQVQNLNQNVMLVGPDPTFTALGLVLRNIVFANSCVILTNHLAIMWSGSPS